ncbi:hypothetical protein L7F22_023723 [Adiantum nelumboides]|nr:hypothetical protein [Adiantum nelumboides]
MGLSLSQDCSSKRGSGEACPLYHREQPEWFGAAIVQRITIPEADDINGFTCCTGCGRVLDDNVYSSEPTFTKGADGQSSVQGNFVRDRQYSTYNSGGEGHQYATDSHERTLERGRDEIRDIADFLAMSSREDAVNAAHRLYIIAVERNFTRGRRTTQVAAACLYIICRKEQKPFLLIDFSDCLQTNVYVLGAVFLQLCKLLSLEQHPIIQKPVDPSLFIHRFTDRLLRRSSVEGKRNIVAQTALRLVASMKRDWMQTGRRPSGICGAALFISAHIHGFECTKTDVVSVVHICEGTLTKRLIEFENTESGSLTAEEFESRAEEFQSLSQTPRLVCSAEINREVLCEHKAQGAAHYAVGLCKTCYDEFIRVSGGMEGGAAPPAFQASERKREAEKKKHQEQQLLLSATDASILKEKLDNSRSQKALADKPRAKRKLNASRAKAASRTGQRKATDDCEITCLSKSESVSQMSEIINAPKSQDSCDKLKQLKPIKLKGIKLEDMYEDEWNEMDELALSTIMLTLTESVYFNLADEVSAYDAWTKLSGFYEKQSSASQVYWRKKLVDLKMKEGTPMSNHLNEFNTIYSQLSAQGVRFDEPINVDECKLSVETLKSLNKDHDPEEEQIFRELYMELEEIDRRVSRTRSRKKVIVRGSATRGRGSSNSAVRGGGRALARAPTTYDSSVLERRLDKASDMALSCIEESEAETKVGDPTDTFVNHFMTSPELEEPDKEDTLSDIDDNEVDGYLHNQEEIRLKTIIWTEMNKEYLEEQQAKQDALAASQAAQAAVLAAGGTDSASAIELAAAAAAAVAELRKDRKRKRDEAKSKGPAESATEATRQMLQSKKLSSKVNYNALEKLFDGEATAEEAKKLSDNDKNKEQSKDKHVKWADIDGPNDVGSKQDLSVTEVQMEGDVAKKNEADDDDDADEEEGAEEDGTTNMGDDHDYGLPYGDDYDEDGYDEY